MDNAGVYELGKGKSTGKKLTVKIELYKVDPYKIWWIGEKTFTHRAQEETFVRFIIDPDGKQVGDFTYVEKKFVTPYGTMGVVNPNSVEPTGASSMGDGASSFESGSEESRQQTEDRR